jgi:divalent metal cation (Fe/Co/Zn/Cd) transporter
VSYAPRGPADATALPRATWVRRALWLVAGTMAYNAAEALIALWAGAEAGSIALFGFGLDSVIELAAGAVVLWRMTVEAGGAGTGEVERAERRVRRFVGVTFFALAVYVTAQAARTLWRHTPPGDSPIGVALAVASLIVMPVMAWGKRRAARALESRALAAEAKETLACSYLSLCLLLGLGANLALGWWWADPAAALLMVPWLVHEGVEGVREESDGDE